jgi:multidrug resistance efflux pump
MRTVKTFDNLKDSQLLYEKTLPVFGYTLLLIILALLAGVIIWSVNVQKMYVVRSAGSVQSVNKNYVMSPYTGKIMGINISEGDNVEKGDVLVSVVSTELDLQDKQLTEQRKTYEAQVKQNKKLVRSIQGDKNLFSASDPDDSLYYSQFEMYKEQIAQQKPDTVAMKSYGYTDAQIASEIQKSQAKVAEIYAAAIKSAEDQALQAQSQMDGIDAQLGAVDLGQSDYNIVANESGRIHMLAEYKEGMVIQAASPIASIGSENDEYKIVANVAASDAPMVETGDTVDISVTGLVQNVYGTISGKVTGIDSDVTVPQSEGSQNAQPYFKIDIAPDTGYLLSKDGHKVNISNGMSVETRITYDKVSYMEYVLESLGLLERG